MFSMLNLSEHFALSSQCTYKRISPVSATTATAAAAAVGISLFATNWSKCNR